MGHLNAYMGQIKNVQKNIVIQVGIFEIPSIENLKTSCKTFLQDVFCLKQVVIAVYLDNSQMRGIL